MVKLGAAAVELVVAPAVAMQVMAAAMAAATYFKQAAVVEQEDTPVMGEILDKMHQLVVAVAAVI